MPQTTVTELSSEKSQLENEIIKLKEVISSLTQCQQTTDGAAATSHQTANEKKSSKPKQEGPYQNPLPQDLNGNTPTQQWNNKPTVKKSVILAASNGKGLADKINTSLKNKNIDSRATSFIYGGARIEHLHGRIKNFDDNPSVQLIIQGGGNNITYENKDQTMKKFTSLIKDLGNRKQHTAIVEIPYRRGNQQFIAKINDINWNIKF